MLTETNPKPKSMAALLQHRASAQADKTAFIFLANDNTEKATLTYGELDAKARRIGGWLQKAGMSGKPVLMLLPDGAEFITTFFGCLYAEAPAVPLYPPRPHRPPDRFEAIINDVRPALVITTSAIVAQVEPLLARSSKNQHIPWRAIEEISHERTEDYRPADIEESSLAFIQYTSGSTSSPKGVMVTHRNLLHNAEMIRQAFQQDEHSVIVGWLPLFHDMGLIGNVLQPLYAGAQCILLSPVRFLQRPMSWLEAITRYRATTSGGPNFGYDLCVRKTVPEERRMLDLSRWKVAFNGAEPVSKDTLDRFAQAFSSVGFRYEAFSPCYGLAESTLFVSGGAARSHGPTVKVFNKPALERHRAIEMSMAHETSRNLVSCGKTWLGQELRIVDPELLTECPSGHIGEVWVGGPSVANGYWRNPEETKTTFQARLKDTNEGPFLRTGDLGFIARQELFVTGRLKDVIVIRGRNHYPQDIELAIKSSDTALQMGEGAAFSIEINGEEQLVVVQEVSRWRKQDLADITGTIRKAISEEHALQAHAIVLIKPGAMLKTSSGKVRRSDVKNAFLNNNLEPVFQWCVGDISQDAEPLLVEREKYTDTQHVERQIIVQIANRLGCPQSEIDAHQPLAFYGLDSLANIELARWVEITFNVSLPASSFLPDTSVAKIAGMVLEVHPQDQRFPDISQIRNSREFPLAGGQAALWFLCCLAPQSAAYNLAGAARIRGTADPSILKRAFQAVLDRHSLLKARFQLRDGLPVHVIEERVAVSFHEIEAVCSAEEITRQMEEEANRPFDLAKGPLFCIHVWNTNDEHVLLMTAHHIVMDLHSVAVLLRDLGAFYEAEISGMPVKLSPLEASYEDYVYWQQQLLSGKRGRQLWEYWSDQLSGDLPVLELLADRARPQIQSYKGAAESMRLSLEESKALRNFGSRNRATLFSVLLAVYKVLLFRYTRQKDLLVGCPTSGRVRAQFDSLIGYFANPIAIRSRLSDDLSFREFLTEVRQTAFRGIEHQEFPFSLLVERLNLRRDPSYSPIFQTMFILQKAPGIANYALAEAALGKEGACLQLGPLTLETVKLNLQYSQFDLTLAAAEAEDGLVLSLQYNTDLFDRTTIVKMLEHFTILSKGVIAGPELSMVDLPLLSDAERKQCIIDFNQTYRKYPSGVCLHELFETQVEDTPHAIGVIYRDEYLSYARLNAEAIHLALYLKSAGLSLETPVAVLMERRIPMTIALVGILKAGGAYVSLDAAYPKERLLAVLSDAGVDILITDARLKNFLPEYQGRVVCLEDLNWTQHSRVSTPLPALVSDQSLAYLIYTSGSTGRPKAVGIEHRSAVTLVQWARESYAKDEVQGTLFSTSICFDLSIFELFVPLSCGGTVIMVRDAFELLDNPHPDAVTLINTVPSVLRELLQQKAIPKSAATINVAGEPLVRDLVDAGYSLPGIRKIFNLYGPSEDTTYSTVSLVQQDEGKPGIGLPIANTQVYIGDEYSVLPCHVAGELLIGGDGLARGYLGRPELTAEKFVPDDYGPRPGSRLYKTGDLARRCRDGSIEFLKRIDRQAKVRGFRIELDEIEAVLRQHPSIRQAVVVVQADGVFGKHLIAYIVGVDAPEPEMLRDYLKRLLPAYMVPSIFVLLEEIPLTPSGKIDHKALPAPGKILRLERYIPPRNNIELLLTNIWQEALKLERLGVMDNFFSIGGDSIRSIQVVTKAREAGLHIKPEQIFTFQTIAELAAVAVPDSASEASVRSQVSAGSPLPENISSILEEARATEESTNVEGICPLTSLQEGMLFECFISPEPGMYVNQQSYTLRGNTQVLLLQKAFQTVLDRHQSLRSAFLLTRQGKPFQVVHSHLDLSWVYHDWSDLAPARKNASINDLLLSDQNRGFDLAHPPLFRVMLVRLEPDLYEFTLTFHLLLLDGWSIALIFQELLTLYEAHRRGQHVELPSPPPIRDYAEWLLQHEQPEAEIYWRQLLEGFTVANSLGMNREQMTRPDGRARRGEEVLACDRAGTAMITSFARKNHLTVNTLLQGAWGLYLAHQSGLDDIIFGSVVSGRSAQVPGIGTMVGMFLNTLPVRLRIDGQQQLLPWLQGIQAQTAQSRRYETSSLSDIQRWGNRGYGEHLFESIVIFQNFPLEFSTSRPGEDLTVLSVKWSEVNNYPLTLIGTPGEELLLKIAYACDSTNERAARRMLEEIHCLLERMASNPQSTLDQLFTMDGMERARVIENFTQDLELQ